VLHFIAMTNSSQNSHEEKADDQAQPEATKQGDQRARSGKGFGLSNFLVFAFGSVGLVFIGIAINYHTKGGYDAAKLALLWGIIGFGLFGVGLYFAYYEYVVKPARAAERAKHKAEAERALPFDTTASIRPLLALETARFVKLADGRGHVEVTVRNSGQDAAKNATVYTSIWGTPIEKTKDRECPDPLQAPLETMPSIGVFGIGERKSGGTGVILTKEQVANIEKGQTRLFVYLIANYEGLSGGSYLLKYYGRYDSVIHTFHDCPTHNDST
jgi:hypothetical protein